MITPSPENIVYCYGEFQSSFAEFPTVEIQEGLPHVDQFVGRQQVLLITDRRPDERNRSECINMFIKLLHHHKNVSVVFITLKLFHKNKFVRPMKLNTRYIVMFKNPRYTSQVAIFARHMYPSKTQFVVEAYENATREPYGNLLIDLRLDTDDRYRIRMKKTLRRSKTVHLSPKSIEADAETKLTIQDESSASARHSAGIKTAESYIGQRQTHVREDLQRPVRQLRVRVHLESVKRPRAPEVETVEIPASLQTTD
jgi:hypothetical protein